MGTMMILWSRPSFLNLACTFFMINFFIYFDSICKIAKIRDSLGSFFFLSNFFPKDQITNIVDFQLIASNRSIYSLHLWQ